jgi:hypothetical protein
MIKKGDTPLPINKVGPMAKALQIEPGLLLRLVFAEYYPDTWAELGELLERILLTNDEIEMVHRSRARNRTSAAIKVVIEVAVGVCEAIRPAEALRMFNGEIPTPSIAGGMVKVVTLLGNSTAAKRMLQGRMQVDVWVVATRAMSVMLSAGLIGTDLVPKFPTICWQNASGRKLPNCQESL